MRSKPAARQAQRYLAGAGLGLAMISALAGWHVAAPKAGGVAFVPPASVPAPRHSPLRSGADSSGTQSAPLATAQPPPWVAPSSAPTLQSAALPPPAASRPDFQAASQRLFIQSRSASIPTPEPLDPYLPGHSLAAAGQRVYVEGMQYHQPTNQTALDVAVVPDAQAATASRLPSAGPEGSSPLPERFGRGFTDEEELFRSKWGWESYNATMTTAQEVAASTARP